MNFDLIGLEFKRNRYGLSNWTSVIDSVWFSYRLNGEYFEVIPMIKSVSGVDFEISEIVVIRESDRRFIKAIEYKKSNLPTKNFLIE